MAIPVAQCHVGWFDEAQCAEVAFAYQERDNAYSRRAEFGHDRSVARPARNYRSGPKQTSVLDAQASACELIKFKGGAHAPH